jgi:hypothetical protein
MDKLNIKRLKQAFEGKRDSGFTRRGLGRLDFRELCGGGFPVSRRFR